LVLIYKQAYTFEKYVPLLSWPQDIQIARVCMVIGLSTLTLEGWWEPKYPIDDLETKNAPIGPIIGVVGWLP